ncbi:response regulator [Nisaea acidiphila]|uniref:Response regulator n=1 Tax=Nisaea acidiphila TaxID=1862145 RepID=A0A9J7AX90_9PROT|nr:response regulator [Nisaea acidiphila]UUX50077.1 response regulator [Nisaea acidiphila]
MDNVALNGGNRRRETDLGIRRVLIVDDIHEIQSTLRRVFRMARVEEIVTASNIDEARTQLEVATKARQPFDIVFMDQMMPGGTGTELLEEVVARGNSFVDRRFTGFFILSGVTEPGFREKAKAAGAIDVMQKPFSAEQLLQYGRKWIQFRSRAQSKPNPEDGAQEQA